MSYNIYHSVRYIKLSKKYIEYILDTIFKTLKKQGNDLSVHLVGDARMRSINKDYRGVDATTDVIAFAMQEGKVFDKKDLGDIFISVNQIKTQANQQKIHYKEEFTRVLIHGVLHLNGYDHIHKKGEKEMFELQEKILKKVLK